MSEISNEIKIFQNEYGTISLTKVYIAKIDQTFNTVDVACIKIKTQKRLLFYKKYILIIMLNDETHEDLLIKKNEMIKAERFVRAFYNIRLFNKEINSKS